MDNAEIVRLLSSLNTWWENDKVPESILQSKHRRRDYFYLESEITSDQRILTIRGARQVGKTTIAGQLIHYLIGRDDIDNEHVLYFSIENNTFLSDDDDIIRETLNVYENNILNEAFRNIDDTIYIFIDEIQKHEGWASALKFYEGRVSNLKFIVTGSVSTLIDDEANETLAGRLNPYTMYPMKYIEYVRFNNTMDEDVIYRRSTSLRDGFKRSLRENDKDILISELSDAYQMEPVIPELIDLKNEYLLKGGYPGVIDLNFVDSYSKLDADLRAIIEGDIPSLYSVDKPKKMMKLLRVLVEKTCSPVTANNLANSADMSPKTAKNYLEYLEEFFIINRCPKFRPKEEDKGRGKDKIYIQDVGHYNAINSSLRAQTLENDDLMGPILETVCNDLLHRLQFHLSEWQDARIGYYDKTGEIDFILHGIDYELPIEIKNGDSTSADLGSVKKYIENNSCDFGLAINNDNVFDVTDNVIHIPSWLFFFMC